MYEVKDLGNKELGVCYLASQLKVNEALKIGEFWNDDSYIDPRETLDERLLPKNYFEGKNDLYLKMLEAAKDTYFIVFDIDKLPEDTKYKLALYMLLRQEIINRGFNINDQDLYSQLVDAPTYLREISPTDYPGDGLIDYELEVYDYPVREACQILDEKGYVTYWSSANIDDCTERYGHAIKDKNVAYILIDPNNLTTELKNELLLNGECNFWGLALNHADNGKYYGIWVEITSPNMLCKDLSEKLSQKALALPKLNIEKNKPKR